MKKSEKKAIFAKVLAGVLSLIMILSAVAGVLMIIMD